MKKLINKKNIWICFSVIMLITLIASSIFFYIKNITKNSNQYNNSVNIFSSYSAGGGGILFNILTDDNKNYDDEKTIQIENETLVVEFTSKSNEFTICTYDLAFKWNENFEYNISQASNEYLEFYYQIEGLNFASSKEESLLKDGVILKDEVIFSKNNVKTINKYNIMVKLYRLRKDQATLNDNSFAGKIETININCNQKTLPENFFTKHYNLKNEKNTSEGSFINDDHLEDLSKENQNVNEESDDSLEFLYPQLVGKKVSILGDSISSYDGYSNNPLANETTKMNKSWYDGSRGGLTNVNKTWWMNTINRMGMELLVNNSSSGSRVMGPGSVSGSVIDEGIGNRTVNLHNNLGVNPDIIVIFMGTNDLGYNKVGTYSDDLHSNLIIKNVDGSFSYTAPANFTQAYIEMIHKIITKYKDADVYCMTLLPTESYFLEVKEYNESIINIAKFYNLKVVDLYKESGITYKNRMEYFNSDLLHPNEKGMNTISNTFIYALLNNY